MSLLSTLATHKRVPGSPYDPRLPCPVHNQESARDPPPPPLSTDLTDAECKLVTALSPASKPGGRLPVHDRRELVSAMAYRLRPAAPAAATNDLPPSQTVYRYFRSWRQQGLSEQLHHALHVRERVQQGRRPTLSATILTSQNIETTEFMPQYGDWSAKTAVCVTAEGSERSYSMAMASVLHCLRGRP